MSFHDATVIVTWITPLIVVLCMWVACRTAYCNGRKVGREDHAQQQIAEESYAIMKSNGIPHEVARRLANFPEDLT